MGKKKGKKKGGAGGDEGADQQPSTSSAPAPPPVVEQPPPESGKKRGKGKKQTQEPLSMAPTPHPVMEPTPPASLPVTTPVPQQAVTPAPQPEVLGALGAEATGGKKKRGKGVKAGQVEQPPSAAKPGLEGPGQVLPQGQRPSPAPESPGLEEWPSLGGPPKGKHKRAQGPAGGTEAKALSPPPGMQIAAPEIQVRTGSSSPQELLPMEPQQPGTRRGVQIPRVVPVGRGAGRAQPAQRPLAQPGSPRVSPPQELPPSEPQLPGSQVPRRPPPGMGGKPQPAPEAQTRGPPGMGGKPQPAPETQTRGPPGMGGKPQPAPEAQTRGPPGMGGKPQPAPEAQTRGPPAAGAGRPGPVQQLTKEMSGLTLQIPARKKTGTAGKKIRVATNMLALNLNRLKSDVAVHYDVTFDPDKPKRLLLHAMEEFRKIHYPTRFPAFDGRKNLYSCGKLPFGDVISGEVQVKDSESTKEKLYRITVKFASEVDLDSLKSYMRSGTSLQAPQTALQAIDVVLRHAASFRFVKVGRSYFTPPSGGVIDLGDGHEMWYGFFQSAILGWRPFINVDVAHKGFPKALNCVELIRELFRNIPVELDRYQMEDLRRYLKGLKVEYELPNQPASRRTYRVNDIEKSASILTFKMDNGQQVSVAQYFDKEKRQVLKYPNLPCLWVGNKNRENKIFLPMEFCKIVRGQVVQKKMTETQTSNMIRRAATSTDVRKQKIMDALKSVGLSENDTVKEFGLTVSDRFEEIDARILNPPALDYGPKEASHTVQPSRGVWRPSKFREGSKLSNWAILNLNKLTREDELRRLGREIAKMGQEVGMSVSECGSYRSLLAPYRDTRELEQYLVEQKSKNVELVVVVIPEKDVYAKVKQLAEIKIGILTQCIKGRTLGRLNGSTVSNILLKLNSKLNGVNHCLAPRSRPSCLERPIMIVGADVTHPSPDQTNIPSVAAVSASHDPTAFQYNMEYRLQPARVEIIQDLENIMRKQLMYFYNRTRYQPDRIIFYRDGVSEGQFEQVLNAELMAIRRACTSLNVNYKPRITFLVVQKRHHTRFFPIRDQDSDGKNRNVPPGTVVDTDITHPTELDFYLVSHASIQGVSRPTKYHRLWDDSNMDEDELENLTYYLCHLFSRCARSVSYPAPTYYAHLAAYRARVYLEGHQIQLGNLVNEQKLRQTDATFVKNNPMYFV